MDNGKLGELLESIKKDPSSSNEAVNDFIDKNLSSSQANAIQNVLKNPQLIKDILESPRAKQLLEMLGRKE